MKYNHNEKSTPSSPIAARKGLNFLELRLLDPAEKPHPSSMDKIYAWCLHMNEEAIFSVELSPQAIVYLKSSVTKSRSEDKHFMLAGYLHLISPG